MLLRYCYGTRNRKQAAPRHSKGFTGDDMSESRNRNNQTDTTAAGVGGRQAPPPPPPGGGGYLENCTGLNFGRAPAPRDPRLDELSRLGLRAEWLRVAEEIGVDPFLRMWRILDSEDSPRDDSGVLTLRLRSYDAWSRLQRNQHIRLLKQSGEPPRAIQDRITENYGEQLSRRTIDRVLKGS